MNALTHPLAHAHAGRRASFSLRAAAAWIDSAHGIPFPVLVTPRVRDALVLRPVGKPAPGRSRSPSDAHGCR